MGDHWPTFIIFWIISIPASMIAVAFLRSNQMGKGRWKSDWFWTLLISFLIASILTNLSVILRLI